MAWGWRVLSSGEPFTEGRADSEKGNDKVVIVLTDGANTYSQRRSAAATTPPTSRPMRTMAMPANATPGYTTSRIFQGTDVSKTDYSNDNYTKAMNEHFATLCDNAKAARRDRHDCLARSEDLQYCRKGADRGAEGLLVGFALPQGPTTELPMKLYWNATGGNLSDKFKEIADELSNLRIVG